MTDVIDIKAWRKKLNEFVDTRDWRPYHNVKNLAMNLGVESAELMEIFTWHNQNEIKSLHKNDKVYKDICDELADVLMTVIMLADEMEINLSKSLESKLESTMQRYPEGCGQSGTR